MPNLELLYITKTKRLCTVHSQGLIGKESRETWQGEGGAVLRCKPSGNSINSLEIVKGLCPINNPWRKLIW